MSRKLLLALALLVVLSTMGVAVLAVRTRSAGKKRLRAVLAEQTAQGLGSSLEDLLLGVPALDPARQQRCWDWVQARAGQSRSYSKSLDESWYFARAAQPPEDERVWAESLRPAMEGLRKILAEGPVCLSSLGWLREDLVRLSSLPVSQRQLRMPHLLCLREAHRWFALEAMTADDTGAALDALDALHTSLRTPAGMIDAMIGRACAAMRDRAYARLALRGDLPAGRLERWLAEPESGIARVAGAFRGERLVYWAPLGQDLVAGAAVSDHYDAEDVSVGTFLQGAADTALVLEFLGALEGHLRGAANATALRMLAAEISRLGMPFEIALPNWTAVFAVAVQVDSEHRLVRLGVVLARAAREHGRIPATEEEARLWAGSRAGLMDAGRWRLRLKYERLGTKRYRVAIDPTSPIPPILEGTKAADSLVYSPHGTPPHPDSVLLIRQAGFEFETR